jgi:flavin reductase (DIM6/NTAB) family NADH-FMN oxidoreductase RutF
LEESRHPAGLVAGVSHPARIGLASQEGAAAHANMSQETRIIDARTFWRALGQRAIGSTVVTAQSSEGPAGFLGLSATHVSAEPPLMLVSVDKRTSALATILAARHFAINFLPRECADLAEMFGGKGERKGSDRFDPGRWGRLATGAPVLLEAVGAIDCALEETIDRGGVAIVIGRVVDVLDGADREPLVHFRGGYLR